MFEEKLGNSEDRINFKPLQKISLMFTLKALEVQRSTEILWLNGLLPVND